MPRPRHVALAAVFMAMAVFCVVQDRVTAAGAVRYVTLQRAALTGNGPLVQVDDVMAPAIGRSVRLGLLSGGMVLAAGLAAAALIGRPGGRWRRE